MCDDLNGYIPEPLNSAQSLVFDLFVLREQQILELAVNVFVFRLSCFLMREAEIPGAEDFVAIQIWCVVDSFNKRRSIRAQETYGNNDEQNVVQYSHGEEVSVRKAVVANAVNVDRLMSVAAVE